MEQVIINLRSLEVLNGLDIDRDELKKEPDVFDSPSPHQQDIVEEEEEDDLLPAAGIQPSQESPRQDVF